MNMIYSIDNNSISDNGTGKVMKGADLSNPTLAQLFGGREAGGHTKNPPQGLEVFSLSSFSGKGWVCLRIGVSDLRKAIWL